MGAGSACCLQKWDCPSIMLGTVKPVMGTAIQGPSHQRARDGGSRAACWMGITPEGGTRAFAQRPTAARRYRARVGAFRVNSGGTAEAQPFRPVADERAVFLHLPSGTGHEPKEDSMLYEKVSTDLQFAQREEKVLEFWRKNRIFEKTLTAHAGAPSFSFYDGPPTANGKPHVGHLETRSFKDLFCNSCKCGFRLFCDGILCSNLSFNGHNLAAESGVKGFFCKTDHYN